MTTPTTTPSTSPSLPPKMRPLPTDKHHRPIPWFVHRDDDGTPDFRVIRARGIEEAYHFGWCWVCGQPRGRTAAFVIGPMCAVNRVVSEPPSHLECATYSALACPFLSTPRMTRRTTGLPDERVPSAGSAIERNPGAAIVWSSKTWRPFRVPEGMGERGVLFYVGDPIRVAWYANGRDATRDEALDAIASGIPTLQAEAEQDRNPEAAAAELGQQHMRALELVPE